jgi:hypothetical protein
VIAKPLSRALPSGQIHADGFRFSGLRIDAHLKGDDLALGDSIALS